MSISIRAGSPTARPTPNTRTPSRRPAAASTSSAFPTSHQGQLAHADAGEEQCRDRRGDPEVVCLEGFGRLMRRSKDACASLTLWLTFYLLGPLRPPPRLGLCQDRDYR